MATKQRSIIILVIKKNQDERKKMNHKTAGTGAAWLTPISRSVILPAHASATSGEFITLIALQKGSNEILPADHPGLPKQP